MYAALSIVIGMALALALTNAFGIVGFAVAIPLAAASGWVLGEFENERRS